ncbi:MAG: SIS domain-containing protein [Bryobacterales bacterium]|jgi:D-sedoheptulose 7-phosphate isomerase|nr:SIS domain-containing protein [Bryobacterales bacterium]
MSFAASYASDLQATLSGLDLAKVDQAIQWFQETRDAGGAIYLCGNGGSAASVSHIACDIVKGCSYQKDKKFRVMALTDNLATITAYANDVGYSEVFVEPLRNFAKPGDLVVAVSGSGNSPNVVKALEYARTVPCRTIAMTGRDGGKLAPLGDLNLHVPNPHMGRIEDAHMMMLHMIAYAFMDGAAR